MKIKIEFNHQDEQLVRDGYEKIQHRKFDEDQHSIRYESIPEYIKAGKKVRRRRTLNAFFDEWVGVILWVAVIGGIIIWSLISNHQKAADSQTSYRHSSTSGIYQADTCAITTCNDGSCSTSTGRGTCSHHGGVKN